MDYIKKCSERLVEQYSTRNPFELCEQTGIFVFYPELPETVKGMYYNVDGYRIIGINQTLNSDEKRIV